MSQHKKKVAGLLDQVLGEASWLLSHAQALKDYGRGEEAAAELERAASCEEQAAWLLEAEGRDLEAALHRVSAASCREQLGQHSRAVTLLRAALSAALTDVHRTQVEGQLNRCLSEARKSLASPTRGKRTPAVS